MMMVIDIIIIIYLFEQRIRSTSAQCKTKINKEKQKDKNNGSFSRILRKCLVMEAIVRYIYTQLIKYPLVHLQKLDHWNDYSMRWNSFEFDLNKWMIENHRFLFFLFCRMSGGREENSFHIFTFKWGDEKLH